MDNATAALHFFSSVIKSGEPWTPTCQEMFDGAINTLIDLESERDVALLAAEASRGTRMDAAGALVLHTLTSMVLDAERQLAALREKGEDLPVWCDTCEGRGTIDNTVGGMDRRYATPNDPCPDCEGKGYWVGRFIRADVEPTSAPVPEYEIHDHGCASLKNVPCNCSSAEAEGGAANG